MNIGLVSQALPYVPSRAGSFRGHAANLIRQLSRRHQIHLVSLLQDGDAEHLGWVQQHCASVRTVSLPRFRRLLAPASAVSAHLWGRPLQARWTMRRALLECAKGWDVMHVEGAYAAGVIPKGLTVPSVFALDSWTVRGHAMQKAARTTRERIYYHLLSYHEPRYERLVFPRFDRCTAVAPSELTAVRRAVPGCNVALVPYGIDTDYFRQVPAEKQPARLVFHGDFGSAPNIDAALELADDILPLVRQHVPNAALHLVGPNPTPKVAALALRPAVTVSANFPDVRPAVCAAQVYVSTLRHGTGIMSSALEAMAMSVPTVGYLEAFIGLSGMPGTHYLVARTPGELASHVVDLLRDPDRAVRLARAGRQLVEADYSWEAKARVYEDLYQTVMKERELTSLAPGVQRCG